MGSLCAQWGAVMSIQQSETNNRNQPLTTPVDEAGQSIIALLGRAADTAKDDCARATALAHKLASQVRAAEERARNAEERVHALEIEVAQFRDRDLRAEDWLRHIHTEVEQAFFKKNGGGPAQLPRGKTAPKQNGKATA